MSNPRLASQYTPGDLIRYRQGSPALDGIPHNSTATVLSVTASRRGDVQPTSPQDDDGREYRLPATDAEQGIRKGELGTITAITDTFNVKLDKGSDVRLNADQARYLEHGYAVESIKAGAPERILFTHEAAANEREIVSFSRHGRKVNIYSSDLSPAQKHDLQSQPAQTQAIQKSISLPQPPQSEAPAIANTQAPEQPAVRIRMGR